MKRGLGFVLACAGVTAVLMVVVPLVAADNGIDFSLRVSSHRLVFRGRTVVFSVRMHTGRSAQTAGIGLSQGGWPDPGVSGAPIAFSHEALSGAGRITGHFASAGASGNPYTQLCSRGAAQVDGGGVDVSLPANSTSTLTYTLRLAAPAWPKMRPSISAYAYVPATDPTGGGVTRELGTEHFVAAGTRGIHVSLAAPEARAGKRGAYPSVSARQAVLIRGRTNPAVPRTEVRLAAKTLAGPKLAVRTQPIGTTRTDTRGRFGLLWRPRKRATYVITANLPHPPPPYHVDRGCDLTLTVR